MHRKVEISMSIESVGGYFILMFYPFLELALQEKTYIGCFNNGCQHTMYLPLDMKREDLEAAVDLYVEWIIEHNAFKLIRGCSNVKLLLFKKYIMSSFDEHKSAERFYNLLKTNRF